MSKCFTRSIWSRSDNRIDGKRLSKFSKIDRKSADRRLDILTQRCVRSEDPSISRDFITDDRILSHNRLDAYFFMDAFFATNRSEKSTKGRACCQLFVTCKSFAHIEPLKKRSDLMYALKIFSKKVRVLEVIIVEEVPE